MLVKQGDVILVQLIQVDLSDEAGAGPCGTGAESLRPQNSLQPPTVS